jgi:hypothetical protein
MAHSSPIRRRTFGGQSQQWVQQSMDTTFGEWSQVEKAHIHGRFAPLLDVRGGGASDFAERLDCPEHRSAGRGLFPGRRQ